MSLSKFFMAAAMAVAAILVACGGGSGGGGTAGDGAAGAAVTESADTGGAGSFTAGRIAGFGSIIVSNVRFDDSAASIADDEDASMSRSELRLGMMVEIKAGAITPGTGTALGSATARTVRVVNEIKGPVQASAGGTLTVLGQVVTVTPGTVFDDGASLASIGVGDILEVFGSVGPDGQITATRIEVEGPGTGTSHFKLRGFVADHDGAARTFSIGGARITYAGIAPLPSLADGNFVRVRIVPVPSAGVWTATRIDPRRPFVVNTR